MQCNTIQYNSIQCGTIQYGTMQNNTIQCNTMQFNTIRYNPMQFNTIQCSNIQYNTMQCNTIHCDFFLSHSVSWFYRCVREEHINFKHHKFTKPGNRRLNHNFDQNLCNSLVHTLLFQLHISILHLHILILHLLKLRSIAN